MTSGVISSSQRQLTLEFDEGLVAAHRNLRDCVAAGIYKRGLKRTAADLDLAPGNLSAALSDESNRKFCVDELELYIQTTGDRSPIHYLVAKYLGDVTVSQSLAIDRLQEMLQSMPGMLAAAGLNTTTKKR